MNTLEGRECAFANVLLLLLQVIAKDERHVVDMEGMVDGDDDTAGDVSIGRMTIQLAMIVLGRLMIQLAIIV